MRIKKIAHLIKKYMIMLMGVLSFLFANAQKSFNDVPLIGAEIFIEPGQSDKDVESWFRTLKEMNMPLTRIRMFENYMKDSRGDWDFSLFDRAFKYADKYGVKVYGNLFPATDFTDVGGFKFPRDNHHLQSIAEYIKQTVTHFKQFRSLYGWVPINEPGGGNLNNDLATQSFKAWKEKNNTNSQNTSRGYLHFSFDANKFLLNYNTWYLQWLTNEIRKYDKESPVHVNNHQIFENIAEYDFSEWSKFLTSLGGSAHASWHFGYFTRDKYAVAISANSEIIRSGAKNIPWLMTEIQGGNNIYSGYDPMCPTKEEIAQWLWISLGAGSKGAIFWCLNPRASGTEAGEWAMIDFKNKPTDRLLTSAAIASEINKRKELFAQARPVNSDVHIVYIKEALWVEKKMLPKTDKPEPEGRSIGSVMKSAIAFFEALTQMGLQPSFQDIENFDFNQSSYSGQTMILANQIALPYKHHQALKEFVSKGGTIIADGLTGFYDENAISLMLNDFALRDLFGGEITEYKFIGDIAILPFNNDISIPSHMQAGYIKPLTAKTFSSFRGNTIASVNNYGKGKVVWIPSLIGLGSRIKKDYSPLIQFLNSQIDVSREIKFDKPVAGVLMKTLESQGKIITILVNKNKDNRQVTISGIKSSLQPKIIYSDKKGSVNNQQRNNISIDSEETIVLLWK